MCHDISVKFINVNRHINEINNLRINRALAIMKPEFRHVYTLLPLLFHYNHPLLPGYQSERAAFGIYAYQPTLEQKKALAKFCSCNENELIESQTNEIMGIYSMGSTASIGQNFCSDFDIWICYQPTMSNENIKLLREKCRKITRWAFGLGVDVNFFFIEKDRFRSNISGCLDEEDCGSTQHILLLEEFYRSAVRLAGKQILWYAIPPEYEGKDYDRYVQMLIDTGALNYDEWLDLGSLSALSAKEYFGASLWQLYKSIDSPYKAVLKALLLEAYSWEYPNTKLLASEMKQLAYYGNAKLRNNQDCYLMMLQRVTRYLEEINDTRRLDLVRRCFYLKVREPLSQRNSPTNWRRHILQRLVKQWGWSDALLTTFDNPQQWKIELVRKMHDELLDAMMQSYRNLLRFARKNNLNTSANPHDIGVLTRKLYAAFEALPGKITLFNPLISSNLCEDDLTFIQVCHEGINRAGWYLFNRQPKLEYIVDHRPLEFHPYLSKLIAWSYFNGLLTDKTVIHIKSSLEDGTFKIKQFIYDITRTFPYRVPVPSPKALYSPCEIKHLAIIANLEDDPTIQMIDSINAFYHYDHIEDIFNFGAHQQSLIGSIDLLYRNSWNEVKTLHFSGPQAMLDSLKTILAKMHQDARQPEKLDVFCYSRKFSKPIVSQVKQLVMESIQLRLSVKGNEQSRFKAIKIAGQIWGVFFERLGISIRKLENAIDFYGAISKNKLSHLPVYLQSGEIAIPSVIDSYASEGIIQFFFRDTEIGFTLYIVDESNHIEVYRQCEGEKSDLVYDISGFYASSNTRSIYSSENINFNLPQFYQIVECNGIELVEPFNYTNISAIEKLSTTNTRYRNEEHYIA